MWNGTKFLSEVHSTLYLHDEHCRVLSLDPIHSKHMATTGQFVPVLVNKKAYMDLHSELQGKLQSLIGYKWFRVRVHGLKLAQVYESMHCMIHTFPFEAATKLHFQYCTNHERYEWLQGKPNIIKWTFLWSYHVLRKLHWVHNWQSPVQSAV